MSARLAAALTTCQTALGVILSSQIVSQPTYSPEDHATVDAGRRGPLIDGAFRPHRNWNGADVLSLANQVSDYPALLANLEILRSQSNQFRPSQAAANQQRKNRPITFASDVVGRWLTE